MPLGTHIPQLPLLLAGLPAGTEAALRNAGIPCRPLRGSLSAAEPAGRFVLFDSSCEASRREAATAASHGLETVDLSQSVRGAEPVPAVHQSGIISMGRGDSAAQSAAALLGWLKHEIEGREGIWLRLGDYPFPWRSVLALHDPGDAAEFPLPLVHSMLLGDSGAADRCGPSNLPDACQLEQLRERYAAGLPALLAVAQADRSDFIQRLRDSAECRRDLPLLWIAGAGEMARWWSVRAGISLSVRLRGGEYRIQARGDFDGFRPSIELWRNRHVARVPLSPGLQNVSEAGLAFVREGDAHPGGFLVKAAEARLRTKFSSCKQRQSA